MSSYVFNSYIYKLNSGKYRDFYNPSYFDVWFCPRGISLSGCNTTSATMYTLNDKFSENHMVYFGNLGNMHVECNDGSGLPSEATYQEIFDLPASAYMFSRECPGSAAICKDQCYIDYEYSVEDMREYTSAVGDKYITDGQKSHTMWKTRSKYFTSEYNFASAYDAGEYTRYGMPDNSVKGENISLMAEQPTLNTTAHNAQGGALLVTWYTGKRLADISADYVNSLITSSDPEDIKTWRSISGEYASTSSMPVDTFDENNAATPCIYYELPMDYKLSNATVNIKWSENGLYIFS